MKSKTRRWFGPIGLVAWFSVLVASSAVGCSLSRKKAECESTRECREAFGTGTVCADDGLCESARVEPNCLNQVPGDLLISPANYKNYVVLGSLLRAEGKEGARQDSALLALDAVNNFLEDNEDDYPNLKDLRFGIVQCTHEGDVNEVARLAEYLVDTLETPAILGPASSSATQAAFLRVNLSEDDDELRRVVFMSPSATSVALTELESRTPGFLWRTAPTDDGQGKLMARFILEEELDYIALYEDTPYGRGLYEELQNSTKNACTNCGFSFDASDKSLDPLATTLAKDRALGALENAKVVFFMGAQESHLKDMIRRMGDEAFEDKLLFFSDAGASADTVNSVSVNNVERVIGTRPRAPEDGEPLRVFRSIYEARHEESPLIHSFTTNSYDATWLILLSALRAQLLGEEISAMSIADGLKRMTDKGWSDREERDCLGDFSDGKCEPITLDGTRLPEMLEAFTRFGRVDVHGASGDLDFDDDREELMTDADSFEFWHLRPATGDDVNYMIVSGPRP